MGAPPLPARLSSPSGRCMRIGCTHKISTGRACALASTCMLLHTQPRSRPGRPQETSPICPPISCEARRVVLWGPLFAAGVGTGDQNPMGDDWKGGEILRLLAPVALAALPLAAGRWPLPVFPARPSRALSRPAASPQTNGTPHANTRRTSITLRRSGAASHGVCLPDLH